MEPAVDDEVVVAEHDTGVREPEGQGFPAVESPIDRLGVDRESVEEGDKRDSLFPDVIEKAAAGDVLADFEVVSAADWLLADDEEIEVELTPTKVMVEVSPRRKMEWFLRPLSDEEFAGCRRMAMGSKADQQRALNKSGLAGLFDERKYHRLIVALATVSPDLEAQAEKKNVHPIALVEHRFRYKPGWISELAGIVNDISGFDSDKIEVVEAAVGNS